MEGFFKSSNTEKGGDRRSNVGQGQKGGEEEKALR